MGHNSYRNVLLGIAFVVLVAAIVQPSMTNAAYAASTTLTVNGYSLDGKSLSMWITIQRNGSTVKSGYTPLAFTGTTGAKYTVTASDYVAGNVYFDHWGNGSTSKSVTVTLNSNTSLNAYYRTGSSSSTITTVTSSSNPSVFGQSASFTATISPSTATGTVQFKIDGSNFGSPVALSGSSAASNSTSILSASSHTVTAVYSGDSIFTGSTGTLSQTVNQASTSTTVTSSANPSVYGQSVTFTATVAAVSPGSGTPSGTITFKDGATMLGTGTLDGTGTATFAVAALSVGSHSIIAQYDGATNFATSTSFTLMQTVNSASTSTTTHNLTVNAYSSSGSSLGMYTTISSGGTVVKTGFTPLTYTGTAGATYTVLVSNYGSYTFDHWEDGTTTNPRTVTLNADVAATAYYNTLTTTTTTTGSSTSPTSIQTLIPKTGILVSLYMYPDSTGSTYWQQVIDQKLQHPSVPIVAVFNPSSGPGTAKDSNIATWVAKLQSAGVLAIGYKSDNYGTTSLADFNAAADSYKNWYNVDGLFIDEFTNQPGYETHYSSLTSYAKSIGMKITVGNPGTDVPPSYIGTVDVINTSEGSGYISLSDPNLIGSNWVSGGYLGWHQVYDKRNFSYVRYGASSLDTTFEVNSSQWVGLLYLTDGTNSTGRWFNLPSYFATEVTTLDR